MEDPVSPDPYLEVFEEWVRLRAISFGLNGTVSLTPPRRKLIRVRLQDGYTTDELKSALVAATHSDWVREKSHFDFHHIFRPNNIDRYLREAEIHREPRPRELSAAEKRRAWREAQERIDREEREEYRRLSSPD